MARRDAELSGPSLEKVGGLNFHRVLGRWPKPPCLVGDLDRLVQTAQRL